RISEVVALVLDANEAERESRLRELCGDDLELFDAARRLLAFTDPAEGAFSDVSLGRQREALDGIIDRIAQNDAREDEGWLPSRIGPYEILRTIGRGGTGVVFEARQERPSRSVAIKLLHPAFATTETVARLKREAELLGRLRHPGIAQIFEAGLFDAGAGEQPFLAMELIDGQDLLTHARGHDLARRQQVELLCRVADAVAHAHQRGVVHRDLKPENILVDSESGQPKLLDFGIAGAEGLDASLRATSEGQLLGTVGYMAPEQARRSLGEVSPATDVYSLCTIGYELIVHRPLRQVAGLSLTQALTEVAEREAPRLAQVTDAAERMPRDLATVLQRGLELRPQDRYAGADELAADLRRWLEKRPILARPPTRWDRAAKFVRRNPVLVAGVTATTLTLLAGLGATLYQARLAQDAEARARRELFAAEMVLATRDIADPATSQQIRFLTERWRPSAALAAEGIHPGFEWQLLDSVRRRRIAVMETVAEPLPIAWSPDATRLAVGMGGEIGVYDATTGKELSLVNIDVNESIPLLTNLSWEPEWPHRVHFGGVRARGAWDIGESAPRWNDTPEFSSCHAVLPDGRYLSVRENNALEVLDAATGEVLDGVPGPWDQASHLELHRASGMLTLPSMNWNTSIHDATSLDPIPSDLEALEAITWASWHPAGDRIAVSLHSGEVKIYGVSPWREIMTLSVHGETAHCVDWSHDGRYLASASSDRTVRLHDGETGELLRSFVGHTRPVRQVHFSPPASDLPTRMASVGSSGRVIVWDVEEEDAVRIREVPGFGPFDLGARLDWKPELGELIAWDRAARLRIRLPGAKPAGSAVNSPSAPPQGVTSGLTLGLGRTYLSAKGEWLLRVLNGTDYQVEDSDGEVRLRWTNPGADPFLRGAWHPEKPVFVGALASGIYVIEVKNGEVMSPVKIAPLGAQVSEVAWDTAGRRVAVSTLAGRVLALEVPSGRRILDLTLPSPVGSNCVAFHPDGGRVAVGCSDGAVRVAQVDSGSATIEGLVALRGHSGEIEGIAWHPDGSRMATASRDKTVKLWSPDTGQLVGTLQCQDLLSDVAWVRDGAELVAVDLEGRIYFFDASRSSQERSQGVPQIASRLSK
ncbi:MAG: serine/threonine-protein kinase, partial [Planctomycetota bacterium]